MDYVLHICIAIGLAASLALSYNLVAGYAGLLSICHAALYGISAYTAALLAVKCGFSFLSASACAVAVASATGALIGWASLRARGDDFVIATFAFQVLLVSVLTNWVDFTGGPMGIAGIPEPHLLGWTISSQADFLLLTAIGLGLVLLITYRTASSPFGRVLRGIREDEAFIVTAARNATSFKMRVFVLAAAFTAIPGVLYAYYMTFIDPSSFTVLESVFIITVVIVGGAGSKLGPIAGAVLLVSVPELLRFFGLPTAVAANVRQILYGGLLVVLMVWRPQGLLGEYTFQGEEAGE